MASSSSGNAYKDFTAQGHSRVIAGNVYGDVVFKGEKGKGETPEERCRRQMFVAVPEAQRASLLSKKGDRVDGTCTWIREDSRFQEWLRSDHNFLWVCGGAGKGKTMLSIYLSEELEHFAANDGTTRAIYTFCSSSDERSNTAVWILRHLISQIIEWRHELCSELVNYFADNERGQMSVTSREVLWRIFLDLCQDSRIPTIHCVLDGLDECDDSSKSWLSAKLMSLFRSEPTEQGSLRLKLVLVSRSDAQLRRAFAKQPTINLDTDLAGNTTTDVETFVLAKVHELQHIDGFDDEMSQHITKTFLEHAESTFLWIGYVMEEIAGMTTCTEIYEMLESLKTLPKGLDALYDRMLLNIPDGKRQKVFDILVWVTLAVRPLTIQQLADALDVQTVGRLSAEQVLCDRLTWCNSFLSIKTEPPAPQRVMVCGGWDPRHPKHEPRVMITLVHHSVQDYLLREDHRGDSSAERFRISHDEGHSRIAQRCLDFVRRFHKSDDILTYYCPASQQTSLQYYAMFEWIGHFDLLSKSACEALLRRDDFFSHSSSVARKWFSLYRSGKFPPAENASPLHAASYIGFLPWVQHILTSASHSERLHLLAEKEEPRGRGEMPNHPLDCALSQGHKETANLLLDYGANPACCGFQTLFQPRYQPAGKILEALLEAADLNESDAWGRSLLTEATERGTFETMSMVFRRQKDGIGHVGIRDKQGNSILHAAALAWMAPVAKLRFLIEQAGCKVLVDAQNSDGRTPLHHVLSRDGSAHAKQQTDGVNISHEDFSDEVSIHLTQMLLDNGADINARDNKGNTPVHEACSGFWKFLDDRMYAVFIKHGANFAAKNSKGETPNFI